MRDSVGNEIHEGAILRWFHYTAARRRREFMYKQVGGVITIAGTEYLEIYHLPIKGKPAVFPINLDTKILEDAVVVQCHCGTVFERPGCANLKRSKVFRD